MKVYEQLKKIYNSLAEKMYPIISKRMVIELSMLFDTPVMTKYHHVLSALRYIAVEEYYGKNNFGRELYVKANCFENDTVMQEDLDRFHSLISSIERNGYDMRSVIYVDRNRNCFNGTHRLALCVWFGVEKIPAYMLKRYLKLPTVQDMKASYQLNDESFARLEKAYQRMYERVHNIVGEV